MVGSVPDDELVAIFAGHPIDHDSAAHYRGRLERQLLINRCTACGFWRHPPKPICPRCWSPAVVPTPVSGAGTIHLTMFLHRGPAAAGVSYTTPYPVVTVELDEQTGLRFTSTLAGATPEDIRIGERVALDWIDRAGVPFPVFRLTEQH